MSDGVGERVVSIVKTSLAVGGVLLAGLLLWSILSPGDAETASARVPGAEVSADPGKVNYDSLPSGSQSTSNYVTGASWTKNPVTYSIGNCPRSLDCAPAHQATREALEAWDAVCGLRLDEVASDGDINILWASGNHGDGQPFDGPGDILGHSFFPISWLGSLAGDIHLDDSETWVVDLPTQQGQAHLKTVVMHEAGHALGLDHSQDSSALMWAEYQGVRVLAPDDIAGAQSLYGPPGPDEGSVAIPAAVSGVTATATVTVRIRSGPGTSYKVVGRVPTNTLLPVLGRNAPSSWLYIDYLGIKGWVSSSLFLLSGDLNTVPVVDQNGNGAGGVPPSQPTLVPVPPGSPTGVTATAKITARVRSGPGTGYLIVARVTTGETVPVLGRNADNTWIYVDAAGVKGWTSARLFNIRGDLNLLPVMVLQEAG
jgi:uncharacterized protein YraI/predicted Zn-dependent protease